MNTILSQWHLCTVSITSSAWKFLQASRVAVIMDEDCTSVSKREDVLRELKAQGLSVAAWGKCLKGTKVSLRTEDGIQTCMTITVAG